MAANAAHAPPQKGLTYQQRTGSRGKHVNLHCERPTGQRHALRTSSCRLSARTATRGLMYQQITSSRNNKLKSHFGRPVPATRAEDFWLPTLHAHRHTRTSASRRLGRVQQTHEFVLRTSHVLTGKFVVHVCIQLLCTHAGVWARTSTTGTHCTHSA